MGSVMQPGHFMGLFHIVAVGIVAAGVIAGILFRPRGWPEAVWAVAGALILIGTRLLSPDTAWRAVLQGMDVYLFLAGMMLLAELARREGVFDWLAALAVAAAKESPTRLFTLVFAVATAVTVFFSNDATAVVLTPAVYAAVRRARVEPLPYLLICAFVANAASFVLPVSNPANLVVFGASLPPLRNWLVMFFAPSLASIVVTFAALRWLRRERLAGCATGDTSIHNLSPEGRRAAWGLLFGAFVLLTASALGENLGAPVFAAALAVILLTARPPFAAMREIAAGVSWSILPLVAGLFVIVAALDRAGAAAAGARALDALASLPGVASNIAAAFGVAALSNLMNNLPAGLLARGALGSAHTAVKLRNAVLVGIDLGPNLSVTGSLATVLWLIALRREGETMSGWQFLKAGIVVMTPALLAAVLFL